MDWDPNGIVDHQLQPSFDGKIIRVKGKTAEQNGIDRIGLGVDQLKQMPVANPGAAMWINPIFVPASAILKAR